MRYMPDEKLKKAMLDEFVEDIKDVFLVVDDRDKVVKMWRSLGLNTWQVAEEIFKEIINEKIMNYLTTILLSNNNE